MNHENAVSVLRSSDNKSATLTHDAATVEILSCCKAIVASYNKRLSIEIDAVKKGAERSIVRANNGKSANTERRVKEIKQERDRLIRYLDKAKEQAGWCLKKDASKSITSCIEHFQFIVEMGRDNTRADSVICDAARHMLPLTRKLKSLLHISRAYPSEVMKRSDKIKSESKMLVAT